MKIAVFCFMIFFSFLIEHFMIVFCFLELLWCQEPPEHRCSELRGAAASDILLSIINGSDEREAEEGVAADGARELVLVQPYVGQLLDVQWVQSWTHHSNIDVCKSVKNIH